MFLFSETALLGKLASLKYSATDCYGGSFDFFSFKIYFHEKEWHRYRQMFHCVKHPKLDHGQMSSSRSSCAGEGGHHLQLAPSWMYDRVLHKPRVKMSCITFNRLNSRTLIIWFFLLFVLGNRLHKQYHWQGRKGRNNPTQQENPEEHLRADQGAKTLSAVYRMNIQVLALVVFPCWKSQ